MLILGVLTKMKITGNIINKNIQDSPEALKILNF